MCFTSLQISGLLQTWEHKHLASWPCAAHTRQSKMHRRKFRAKNRTRKTEIDYTIRGSKRGKKGKVAGMVKAPTI